MAQQHEHRTPTKRKKNPIFFFFFFFKKKKKNWSEAKKRLMVRQARIWAHKNNMAPVIFFLKKKKKKKKHSEKYKSNPRRTTPAQTKLLICVWHPFNLWRPPEEMGRAVQRRFPEMRVVHLPNYDRLDAELPDTDIFVGYSIRPNQFPWASKLKWIHSTAAGIAQLSYPELLRFRNPRYQSQRRFLHSYGRAHPGPPHRARSQFSGFRASPGSFALGPAGNVGQAPAFHGTQRSRSLNRGIRLDRPRTRQTRSRLRHASCGA